MKKQILFAFTALLLALPSAQAAKKDAPLYFPPAKGQWEMIDPAKIGWNPAKLKELMDYAGKNKSSGVVILYRGRILAEQYWPLDPKEKTAAGKPNPYFHMRLGKDAKGRAIEDVASAQKSVTAMLVGIAQHKGLLKITDPVHKHLGKGWSKAPADAEAKITITHLITMSSGLDTRLQYEAPAGTKWFYNTTAYSRSLTCVSKAAKMDANILTKKWLTGPLGMKDSRWAVRPWQSAVRTDGQPIWLCHHRARPGAFRHPDVGQWKLGKEKRDRRQSLPQGRHLPLNKNQPLLRLSLVAQWRPIRRPGKRPKETRPPDTFCPKRHVRRPGQTWPAVVCLTHSPTGHHPAWGSTRQHFQHRVFQTPAVGQREVVPFSIHRFGGGRRRRHRRLI